MRQKLDMLPTLHPYTHPTPPHSLVQISPTQYWYIHAYSSIHGPPVETSSVHVYNREWGLSPVSCAPNIRPGRSFEQGYILTQQMWISEHKVVRETERTPPPHTHSQLRTKYIFTGPCTSFDRMASMDNLVRLDGMTDKVTTSTNPVKDKILKVCWGATL